PGALPLASFGLFTADTITSERSLSPSGSYSAGPWEPSIDEAGYADAIRRIKTRIEAGDTYQINFTFRLNARFSGEALALLRDLDGAQAGPWGAYVDDGRWAICSASPELFFRIDGDRIECRPMKGTAPRGLWTAADRLQGERLRGSAKNRAENVMVVDMVRNDLGRIADVGSVQAVSLFDVERYPLQWQMTSTVDARAHDRSLPRIIEALFPSGSVTGAPKHSSMAIIRELETRPRGIYTGAIGYLSPNGRGHFNVAIRTIAIDRDNGFAEFGVGSGIVWDSAERDEYAECLLKASILLERPAGSYAVGSQPGWQLLETIGWTPDAGFALLDRHFDRLRDSASCFGFTYDEEDVRTMLHTAVADLSAPSKVRVLVSRDGAVVCEGIHLAPREERPLMVDLARDPIDAGDVFLYHKTTRRQVYEQARASVQGVDAVLLWNAAGDLTEATDANVVVELDGRKVTPPVECGLLAGTLRAALLATGEIVEERVSVADLRRATRVWLINSVRGWSKADLRESSRGAYRSPDEG
ncbi:MAG: aminodeoxychorismate synthase component I, partial [Acidobacteriota bacterium]